MKLIKDQALGMTGAVTVAFAFAGFDLLQPASHWFLAFLGLVTFIMGILVGLKSGFPALIWVAYLYLVFFVFGVCDIKPFESHDVPPSIVAGLLSLCAAPSGILGAAIGAAIASMKKQRTTKLGQPAL